MVTRVVLDPSEEELEKLIYICKQFFFFFFFLSRRCLNLHFDGVCWLALGKLVKVISICKAKRPYRKEESFEKTWHWVP